MRRDSMLVLRCYLRCAIFNDDRINDHYLTLAEKRAARRAPGC